MKIRRKQRQARTHAVRWGLVFALASFCLLGLGGALGVLGVIDEWTADLPNVEDSDAFAYSERSTVLAADGETVLAEFQLENRDPLNSLDQISTYAVQGTVATEDVRFYDHNGVDLMGIARAVVNNVLGGDLEGASTITQQLVRNTILSDEMSDITLKRKVREAELALDMEQVYSKDDILLMYMNTINYGDGCYGIEAAAQHYFSKPAADLTLAEAAALVGIPQSPTNLNPTTNPDGCQTRRNTVLARMESAGIITAEECAAAQAEPLTLNLAEEDPQDGIHAYPYFTSYVRDLLLEEYSIAEVFEGGLTIYTTLDVDMQEAAEAACEAQYARMNSNLEVSLVAVDPDNGYIKAMVGGKNFEDNQFNIATQKGRPTGSSFKTFTLVTAIEQGINPSTLVDCTSPMSLPGGATIQNYGNINYGIRSIARATAVSSNTGFVRLLQEVGAENIIETAHKMGVTTENLPAVPSLTLGVADITPLDMATAYATLATGGIHHDSVAITKIVDRNGETIYDIAEDESAEGEQVIDKSVAVATTNVLRTVFTTGEGTAYGASPTTGQPVAGKTGTTNNYLDHWLVGYCPQLSCAVWIGDRYNNIQSPNVSPNQVWKQFMSAALAGMPTEQFPTAAEPDYSNPWNAKQNEELSKKDPNEAPNVAGKTLADAQAELEGYEVTYTEEYSDSVAAGKVISQRVEDDKLVVVVSKGSDPSKAEPPSAGNGDTPSGGTDGSGTGNTGESGSESGGANQGESGSPPSGATTN